MTSQENQILSTISKYQTINLVELMALTSGISDSEIVSTLKTMADNKLVSVSGEGEEQLISMTSKGYSYLSSQGRLAMVP